MLRYWLALACQLGGIQSQGLPYHPYYSEIRPPAQLPAAAPVSGDVNQYLSQFLDEQMQILNMLQSPSALPQLGLPQLGQLALPQLGLPQLGQLALPQLGQLALPQLGQLAFPQLGQLAFPQQALPQLTNQTADNSLEGVDMDKIVTDIAGFASKILQGITIADQIMHSLMGVIPVH